jgi:hypothetical protein
VSWATAACAGYTGEYFGNATLTGTPALTRCDAAVDFDWGTGGPGSGLSADNFSVRWTGQFDFPAGAATFTATADDGIRVWVDGTLLIDAWRDQAATTYQATVNLTAGRHQVRVEYYERGGYAVARVNWTTAGAACAPGQYLAEYFGTVTLTGTPALTRCDAAVDFDWGTGGPAAGLGADNFSVRWTGEFDFPGGATTFVATADDGIRVWVDGALLIDAWRDQSVSTYQATLSLAAGPHEVAVEYYERSGAAVARVSWAPAPIGGACPAGYYLAEYFGNATLSGSPANTRCETAINNDWKNGGPGGGLGTDLFSLRWTGRFAFAGGATTFVATADDGIRLWVDGVLLIDAWRNQSATTYRATASLAAGEHEVRVEYYENVGFAVARVSW